jgi:prepilin-type N-terminal cleavage/methylation domain-containing protein
MKRTAMRGFTLTELAVVLVIVSFLIATMMYTLAAQADQRNFEETRRRLETARELLLSYAIVNGRLPCPARSAATAAPVTAAGDEVRDAAGNCLGDAVEDYYGGVVGGATGGLLPARAIGFQQTDATGFAIDAWGNQIGYAVEKFVTNCSGPSTLPHFTNAANMRANGVSCQPRDLLLCKSSTGVTGVPGATSCGAASNVLTNQRVVVAVVYSTGKNFATAPTAAALAAAGRTDEAENVNGNALFVFHTPNPSGPATGEFDDYVMWISAGELYGRLIAAGALP